MLKTFFSLLLILLALLLGGIILQLQKKPPPSKAKRRTRALPRTRGSVKADPAPARIPSEDLRRGLSHLAHNHPERVSQVLKQWLREDSKKRREDR